MILRNGTWADLVVGKYIVDRSDHTWKVVDIDAAGTVALIDAQGVEASLPPMPPGHPIRIFDLTEQEAMDLAAAVLGATPVEAPT